MSDRGTSPEAATSASSQIALAGANGTSTDCTTPPGSNATEATRRPSSFNSSTHGVVAAFASYGVNRMLLDVAHVSPAHLRLAWAPMIEELVNAVPPEVQITKFSGDLQGDARKKCRLTIDGLSAGTDPRKVAEDLRTSIAESFGKKYKNVASSFRSLEDGVETVQLGGAARPTATFAINVEFQGGDETAPSTPARTPKKK